MEPPLPSDALMETLFSDTSRQWRSAIHATVAVYRFRRTLSQSARQQGLGGPEHLQSESQRQYGSQSECDVSHSQASQNEETNQAAKLDKKLEEEDPDVEVLKQIRDELVKQLDAYGLVLVLLAGITFVAILQPPGSFDDGKLQDSLLVSLCMLLATLSFFIACTGLGAVMVGCAQLFRPFFYPKIAKYTTLSITKGLLPHSQSVPAQNQWFRKWLLRCWEIGRIRVALDEFDMLAKLCLENVYRIVRIRIYLGVALVLCIVAYICGALAVMVHNNCQRYMLVGAMGAGGVILILEICITVSQAMKQAEPKAPKAPTDQCNQDCESNCTHGGHPDPQTLP